MGGADRRGAAGWIFCVKPDLPPKGGSYRIPGGSYGIIGESYGFFNAAISAAARNPDSIAPFM
jgi:hypothetical protein